MDKIFHMVNNKDNCFVNDIYLGKNEIESGQTLLLVLSILLCIVKKDWILSNESGVEIAKKGFAKWNVTGIDVDRTPFEKTALINVVKYTSDQATFALPWRSKQCK